MRASCRNGAAAKQAGLESVGRLEPPDEDVLPAGEMEQRLPVGKDDARRRHRVRLDHRLGRLQRPGRMVDLGAERLSPLAQGVEAVALGQPVLERARNGGSVLADGPEAGAEAGVVSTLVGPAAL